MLDILRSAARQAEQTDVDKIDSTIIHEAIPEGRREVTQKNIDQLTPHQRALYEIIREHDSLTPGNLYEHYRERVENPKSNRTVRNYLSKLAHYNLIVKEGHGRGRMYAHPV